MTAHVRWRRVLPVALLATAVLCWWAAPAAAHAVLESASPADGAQLDAPPDEIRLEFSEPVAVAANGLRVHDAGGRAVPLDDGSAGDHPAEVVRASPAEPLPEGSYIVTWRVVSADGHPVAGALVFSVGDPEQLDASLTRQLLAAGTDRGSAAVAAVVRMAGYLTLLAAAGGVAFVLWISDARDRPALRPMVGRIALAGVATALLAVPAHAAEASGDGLPALVRGAPLVAALTSGVGLQSMMQAVALGVVAVALGRPGGRAPRSIAATAAALAVLAVVVTGHTRTTQPLWLTMPAAAVHALAAALWLGGLVLLWQSMRRRRADGDPAGAAGTVARFSHMATIAVAAVSVAGVALGWLLVRTGGALVSTAYGRILLAKVALAAAVMAIGAYNNRRLVPAVTAAAATPNDAARRAWRRLWRTVRWEVAGLTLIVALTAVLVNAQPAAEAAGVTGPLSTTVAVGDDARLSVTVDPNRAGYNEVHLYLVDATGRPADTSDLQLRLTLPAAGIGPIVRTPSPVAPGHWVHAGRELAAPGRWQIEAVVGVSRFEQQRTTLTVDVRP